MSTISQDIVMDYELFRPRMNITGLIRMKSVDDIHVKHYFIEVFGRAECRWESDTSMWNLLSSIGQALMGHKRKKSVHSGEQDFYYSRHTLDGGTEDTVFERRTNHLFPFKCRLPAHLPPSWTGTLGSIRYFARTTLRFADGKPDLHLIKPVVVSQYRDLRKEKHLLNEARVDFKRFYRYSILNLGYVEVSLWLPLCGIAAGQCLPVLCSINNQSAIRFTGIVFVLTQIEIYRCKSPRKGHKLVRKDICRIVRMADVCDGFVEFYAVLKTTEDIYPTSQFWRCSACQLTYEVWVKLLSPLKDKDKYGYPNVNLPGIPLIVGTEPICTWDSTMISAKVMQALLDSHPPIVMEPPPPDEVVEEMLNTVEEDMDSETIKNLGRQIDINENLVDS